MSTKAKRHTHKYYRVTIAGQSVWACALSDCNHYMPKHMENLVPGKGSICWECGEPMILDPNNMGEDKPRCKDCRGIGNIESVLAQKGLL